MNAAPLVLGGLCLVLIGGLVLQRNAASKDEQAATADLLRLSNDWSQAVFKLDEQSRLAFTLQTQLKILNEEHAVATNELPKLRTQLTSLGSNHLAWVDNSRSVSNRLQLRVLELLDEQGDFRQRLTNAQASLLRVELAATEARRELTNAWATSAGWSNEWKKADADRLSVQRQLNDPLTLRSQLSRIESAKAASRKEKGQPLESMVLELQPDGSVRVRP